MKCVFIVDDDNMYQLILQHQMQKLKKQVKVVPFENGEPALNALKRIQQDNGTLPDIVLLDINMPVMDGWQFLNAATEWDTAIGDKIAIHVISSSLDKRDKERALGFAAVKGYISKPVSIEQLEEMLQ